jgi:hypothetical protein
MTKIKGTLSTFRSTTQIHLERHFAVPDTNAEMRFLEARVRFLVEVLAGPWVLADGDVEALREDAEREEVRVDGERRGAERRRRRRVEREERDHRRIVRQWEREERAREREAEVCRVAGVRLMRELERCR